MPELGRILIADDEETFSHATADLLRQDGYECDCAADGPSAARLLKAQRYDLIIADIKMPGNAELELVRDLPQIAEGLPVILVTGYPSLRTAVQSIQLPVVAYLTKPVEIEELRAKVRAAVKSFSIFWSVRQTRQRLEDSCRSLSNLEELMKSGSQTKPDTSIGNFVEITFENMLGALSDLKHLTDSLGMQNVKEEACHLLNCPKLALLVGAVTNAISVLEHTKNSFKSKELGELRRKLEAIVKNIPADNNQ